MSSRRSLQRRPDLVDGALSSRRAVVGDGGDDRSQPVVGRNLTALARGRPGGFVVLRVLAYGLSV
jgi:hypothetical protein